MRQSRVIRRITGEALQCRCFICGRNTSDSSATKVCWGSQRNSGLHPLKHSEGGTFYPMFRQQRAGKTHIRVCRTLSCAMTGSYQLMENLCAATGIERWGHGDAMHNPISVSTE